MNQLKPFIMRKLVFAALAGVFMLSSGFSPYSETENSLKTKNPFYDCQYTITASWTNVFGQEFSETRSYSAVTVGPRDCQGTMDMHVTALNLGLREW